MTYSLAIMALINKGSFKALKITPTPFGMIGTFRDMADGQMYRVDVSPMNFSISEELFNRCEKGKCELCNDDIPVQEILDNNGRCNYCALGKEEVSEDRKSKESPDDPSGELRVRG